jgi:hypothetical protein
MSTEHELDDLTRFENKQTARTLPVGWLLLFWGLIVWGAYYLWAYSPALGGWSQAQELEGGGGTGSGANLLATIAFTALPTLAALLIVMAQRNRKK